MLLGEILASKGHVKEIDHGNKKIIFTHGMETASILITTGQSAEFRYRLEMFHISFERQFKDILKDWDGRVTEFAKTKELIRKFL